MKLNLFLLSLGNLLTLYFLASLALSCVPDYVLANEYEGSEMIHCHTPHIKTSHSSSVDGLCFALMMQVKTELEGHLKKAKTRDGRILSLWFTY